MPLPRRDYDAISSAVHPCQEPSATMQLVADALWGSLRETGVSWVGFYIAREGAPDDRRLELGPHRDGPACSPIGLHGVCGAAFVTGETQIVDDVHALGDRYVACDPRDRSEIVVPVADESGSPWGVLDLDSRDARSFSEHDRDGLERVLRAAGFATPAPARPAPD